MGTVQFANGKLPKLAKPQTRLYDSGIDMWIGEENCTAPQGASPP
jgi:hypothetical protein